MWLDRVSNPGPLTYESDALPTALRGPAKPGGKVLLRMVLMNAALSCSLVLNVYISRSVDSVFTPNQRFRLTPVHIFNVLVLIIKCWPSEYKELC